MVSFMSVFGSVSIVQGRKYELKYAERQEYIHRTDQFYKWHPAIANSSSARDIYTLTWEGSLDLQRDPPYLCKYGDGGPQIYMTP